MSLTHIRSDMNKTRVISNESLDYCSQNYSFLFDRDANLDTSLSDICDTISLYDYDQNDDSKNSKRLTWEEWYLKKKIEKLENEKKMQIAIEKKMASNSKLSEEEKAKKIIEWIEKKKKQKKLLEQELKQVQDKNQKEKEKKEQVKQKSEEKYQKWLAEVKRKELAEKAKRLEDEQNQKRLEESEKIKKQETEKRLKENKKELVKVRPLTSRKGVAIVNGKLRNFFDWSTSPEPGFFNKVEWKS